MTQEEIGHIRDLRLKIVRVLREVDEVLKDNEDGNRPPSIAAIKQAVSTYYNVSINDLNSARRARSLVFVRHMAMYLAKNLTPHSYPVIGRSFGHRDHATAMHAVKRIEGLMSGDNDVAQDVAALMLAFVKVGA
ncbi:helix-turn-helix domain-containing protein [Bradyrhizobium sp.]|uniref:helix-turn-helix domain-containing protein n=1 Tax=Bradyrhizobium sp. TaxID=376 RepID=UPI003C55EB34